MTEYLAFLAAMLTFVFLRMLGLDTTLEVIARTIRGWKRAPGGYGAWVRWAPRWWWPWE